MAKQKKEAKAKNPNRSKAMEGNQNAVGNSGGRPKAIESPEQLWTYFKAYTEQAKKSPYLVHDFVGKDANEVHKEKERPLSWIGFECYLYELGIISDLSNYEENTNGSYTEYLPIIRVCKKIIQKDQLEGATAGVYSQNIVARLLGLTDKKDLTTDGEKLTPQKQVYKLPDGTEIVWE